MDYLELLVLMGVMVSKDNQDHKVHLDQVANLGLLECLEFMVLKDKRDK